MIKCLQDHVKDMSLGRACRRTFESRIDHFDELFVCDFAFILLADISDHLIYFRVTRRFEPSKIDNIPYSLSSYFTFSLADHFKGRIQPLICKERFEIHRRHHKF